ncbi:hypothetical protein N0V93_002647 [Gnomoniopsis smithogilvyi]|uniref:Cytochrome P450 n=1 Tax=Gnomoniopsis smithogilvyi TaxID=1191159 RepID=A0A9W8YVQ3_9PEZI|nr:hypothetical protein N0V93_002647 [Gnomoniopsis smithogilvyi]
MDLTGIFTSAGICFAAYLVWLVVYRLVLSPIAKYPGPKLAALSNWYEFYYEVFQQGHFTAHIQTLHDIYGPIVRITPAELHIRDPDYYDVLYTRDTGRRNKYAYFAGGFGFSSDTFNTEDHDHHRMRRKAIAPFFSVAKINDFQPTIHSKVDKLRRIIEDQYANKDVVVPLDRAWTALTTDIITDYAFARSYNHLDDPGFRETMHEPLIAVYSITKLAMQFPVVFAVLETLPDFFIRRFKPEIMPTVGMRRELADEIKAIRKSITDQDEKSTLHPTIFKELLVNEELPPAEKTNTRLGDEAQLIIAAGLVTTSWALAIATFHLSRDKSIVVRLREELRDSGLARPFDWTHLVHLPYLNGIVHEAIRLSHGTATRHPRRAPDTDLMYKEWKIPRNTPVSMTTIDVMMDAEIFREPEDFKPERWLENETELERYFVPFGKGSRQCLGINLAQAEIYITVATIFSTFDFELYETDETDVMLKHAYLVPYPKWDSKGIRATVKSLARS